MARPHRTRHLLYVLLRHSYCLTLLLLRSYITSANFRRTKFEKWSSHTPATPTLLLE